MERMGARAAAKRALREFHPAPDDPSLDVQRSLIKKWKEEICLLGHWTKMRWLTGQEGIIAFGSDQAAKMAKQLRQDRKRRTLVVCSLPWLESTDNGNPLPAAMTLSRNDIRIGLDGRPHRRLTPSIAIELEDRLDDLSAFEAELYDFPRSPSAAAIEKIGWRKARPVGGQW
jgi:hypothetical protein